MRRREFVTFGGAALICPQPTHAQQGARAHRIGVLETISLKLNAANFSAFRRGLAELGYIEGQNLVIEYRSADGRQDRFADLARELVRLNVDLIVTRGTPAAQAAKAATAIVPVVMAGSGDPVGTGIVSHKQTKCELFSLQRPTACRRSMRQVSLFTREDCSRIRQISRICIIVQPGTLIKS